MSILVFQHTATEKPGVLGATMQRLGHKLRFVHMHLGMSMPDFDEVDGIISLGGPMNVEDAAKYPFLTQEMEFLKRAAALDLPIVGICLGAQLLAAATGGSVAAMPGPEAGWHNVRLTFPGTVETLYNGMPWDVVQFHLHGQEVTKLPPGAVPLASSKLCKTQAFKLGMRGYGFQYHFEWDRRDLDDVLSDELFAKAGPDAAEQTRRDMDRYYPAYRRLGDRLCEQIATLLFPIEIHRTSVIAPK